jgi:hypothetical protein
VAVVSGHNPLPIFLGFLDGLTWIALWLVNVWSLQSPSPNKGLTLVHQEGEDMNPSKQSKFMEGSCTWPQWSLGSI